MTILRIIRGPAGRDTYDTLNAAMQLDTKHPPGLIMHGASEVEGAMQVAQVWETESHMRRFDEELERLRIQAGAPPATEDTVFELHHLVTP
jgi:hypothetical protein